jgi:hypothetical protein
MNFHKRYLSGKEFIDLEYCTYSLAVRDLLDKTTAGASRKSCRQNPVPRSWRDLLPKRS